MTSSVDAVGEKFLQIDDVVLFEVDNPYDNAIQPGKLIYNHYCNED